MIRRLVAVLFSLLALGSCAGPDPSETADRGIGGTGIEGGDRGIGGTGILAAAKGIGGTGIVGTVTGFGSILVNGETIDYAADTPTTRSGTSVSAADLAVGQTVAVVARPENGRLRAQHIDLRPVVRGPVTEIDRNEREIALLDQTVYLPPEAKLAAGAALESLKPGMVVEIYGHRQGGGLVLGTRLQRSSPETVFLSGVLDSRAGDNWTVSGTPVTIAGEAPAARPGRPVTVEGRIQNDRFVASDVRLRPSRPFAGRVDSVNLEGLVLSNGDGPALMVGGTPLPLMGDLPALETGERLQVRGDIGPRGIRVDTIRARTGRAWPAHFAPMMEKIAGDRRPQLPAPKTGPQDRPPDNTAGPQTPSGAGRPERPQTKPPERIERPQRNDVPRPETIERPPRNQTPRPERPDRPGRPETPQSGR